MHYYNTATVIHGPLTVKTVRVYWGEDFRVVRDDVWGVVRYLGSRGLQISEDNRAVVTYGTYYSPRRAYYVVDGCGDLLDPKIVLEYAAIYEANRPLNKWTKKSLVAEKIARKNFRCGPVPNTGKKAHGSWLRPIKTAQEIRENDGLLYDEDAIENDVKPRSRRGRHNLPTSWDDRCRGDYRVRSWKKHRKHQWK